MPEGPTILSQIDAVVFPEPLNTSSNVSEYPLISRALMLQSGSSDARLADMNGDGKTDLVVAQYEARTVSVFYRNVDDSFSTYASLNLTTQDFPIRVVPLDSFSSGTHEIAVLERTGVPSQTRLAVYNTSSELLFETMTYPNAVSIVVGDFSADSYPDIAIACVGPNPSTVQGRIEVFFGPYYSLFEVILAGLGTNSIVAGDFNDDSKSELAVTNFNSSNVMLFDQPFSLGDTPYQILNVTGHPTGLTSGILDGNSWEDIAVITDETQAVRFYFQVLGTLPVYENYNRSLDFDPSFIISGNFSGNKGDDILVLSSRDNLTVGFVQKSVGNIWSDSPDFKFPTNAIPRTALIGELNGDILPDIAITSARSDWSGSSIAIYQNRYPEQPIFCNGNATAWTNRSASPSMIATGDLDGNGIVDLVTLNIQNGTFDFILNFTDSIRTRSLWYTPGELIVYDFNNDNCSEVVTTDAGSPLMTVFYWHNHTSPSNVTNLSANGNIMDIAMGDFNDDGLEDVLVSTDDGRLDFFFNDGTAEPFQALYEYAPTFGAGIWSLTVGDFNTDGLDDVAYTKSIRKINILLQSTSVPFGPLSDTRNLSYNQGSDFTAIWAGDVTGDGKTDIIATRPSDPSLYLFDQNDFVVSPYPYKRFVLPEVPRFVSVMDFTDDGHADVAAMFESDDLLFLYRQNGSSLPVSPSMVFVTGAGANYATIGDGTGDHRGDLLTNDVGSHSVSIWEQINFPPIAHAGGPYYARQGDEFQFNGSAETGTSERLYTSFRWDFGDGNISSGMMLSRPKHVYTEVRIYNVTLEVTDPVGNMSSNTTTVEVLDSYPHVGFTWSPLEPNEGQTVTLTDTTSSFDPVVSMTWSVDEVSVGIEKNISLEFQNGTHSVSLEVVDSDGTVVWLNRTLFVASMLPELRIDAPSYANEGDIVTFRVIVDEWHLEPIDPIVKYEWDFLYFPGYFTADPSAPNNDTATHAYSTSGYPQIFTVAVRVTDADDDVNMTTFNIRIYDIGPVADFVLSIRDRDPWEGEPLSFVSTSYSPDGIINWTWILEYPDGHSDMFTINGDGMVDRVFDDLVDGDYMMSLTIVEADGNLSAKSLSFHVREASPDVAMGTIPEPGLPGYFLEFSPVAFFANVSSFDPIVSYEWDFDAAGAGFVPDSTTATNEAIHTYSTVGGYTAKVRVTDTDGSVTVQWVYVEVAHKWLYGPAFPMVTITKDLTDTSNVTFDLSIAISWFPDIVRASYDFGDGSPVLMTDIPEANVAHKYVPTKDYSVSVNITDDDGYTLPLDFVLRMIPPTVQLLEPTGPGVIRSGAPLLFLIQEGSSAIASVDYNINGLNGTTFSDLYRIDTSGWADGKYTIFLSAMDAARNIAGFNTTVAIDDVAPKVFLSSKKATVFGGDRVNITIRVVDLNVVASGIVLYVRFQGESAYSTFSALKAPNGDFYRILDVPTREGEIDLYANVTDMAGNYVVTSLYTLDADLHFIYRAWPYLLAASVLAAFGTMGYFMRESTIAVDETFVIYNDGRMIAHSTRRLKPGMDDEVMSGMLVAIQDFVKESFKDITSFTLRKLEFGEKSVVIEKGDHLFLAVILHGNASKKVAQKMKRVVIEIEGKFGPHLEDWDGDLEKMRGISDIVKKLYSKAPVLPTLAKENT